MFWTYLPHILIGWCVVSFALGIFVGKVIHFGEHEAPDQVRERAA